MSDPARTTTVLHVRRPERAGLPPASAGTDVRVLTATDGDGAAAVLGEADVDAVVCDAPPAGEPDATVLSTIRHVSSVPVVVRTPEPDGEVAATCTRRGATEYHAGTGPGTVTDRALAVAGATESDAADATAVPTREREGGRETATVLSDLLSTTRSLMAAETVDAVVATATDAAADVLGFPGTGLRRYDPEREVLESVALGRTVEDIADRPPYPVDDSPHGRAFRTGEAVVEDIDGDDDPYDRGSFSETLYVPIGDFGVLSAGKVEGEFDDADVHLAEVLAASTEAALARAERREALLHNEAVLEAVEGMVYALDDDGEYTLVTDPYARRLGYDPDDLVGEHASVVLDEGDIARGREVIRHLLRTGDESATYEAEYRTDAGERFPVEIEISLLYEDGEFVGSVGAVRDVTEQRERERYLQVINRILRHDLRNDLTAIQGYAELVAADADDTADADVARLREVSESVTERSDKVRQLERYVRRGRATASTVDAASVAADVVAECVERFPEATFETTLPRTLPVRGDERLAVGLENLVENAAIHAGDAPQVLVQAREDPDRPGWVQLRVLDDGSGVPPAEHRVVTGVDEMSQLHHGSGVGLWLARCCVEGCGGEIEFDEDADGGTVTLRLRRTGR